MKLPMKPQAVIIEDNAILSNMFARALQDIHYETRILADGCEAMNWLSNAAPSLILLDLHLPNVSGKEILNVIYDDPRFANTYLVLVTADARMGGDLQDKADFLLNKPVDIFQLQRLAQRLKGSKSVIRNSLN